MACEPADGTGGAGGPGTAFDPVTAVEVWGVSGGAGDLAWDGSGLIATAELGDTIVRWDPETDLDEELGSRLGGSPTAVALGDDDTRYVALTDSGVEGFVGVLADLHTVDVLASAAGSALFRRPVDLAWDVDGSLLVADSSAEALWRVPVDGSAATAIHIGVPIKAVTRHQGRLVLATEDGVLEDQDGTLTTLSDLEVRDLYSWGDLLLGTTQDGVVRISDGAVLVDLDAGRPGALTAAGDTLYVADESGGRVWEADLASIGD